MDQPRQTPKAQGTISDRSLATGNEIPVAMPTLRELFPVCRSDPAIGRCAPDRIFNGRDVHRHHFPQSSSLETFQNPARIAL
jgi:hypothetical protein